MTENDDLDKRREEITLYARDFAEEAIDVLREVMNDPDAKSNARVQAANSMLDRGIGAPTRRVEQKSEHHLFDHRQAHLEALKTLAGRKQQKQLTIIDDAEYTEVGE